MGSMFANSDYGDTVDTQLTLGVVSLIGIFFGLVTICGIFFGFGYSIGRRNGISFANAALSIPLRTPAVTERPAMQNVPEPTLPAPNPPQATASTLGLAASVSPASKSVASSSGSEVLTTPSLTAVERSGPEIGTSQPLIPWSSNKSSAAAEPPRADRILMETKLHVAKPSAIQPAMEQTSARIPLIKPVAGPQFSAQNLPSPYFVWTPPFDVRRSHGVTRRIYTGTSRLPTVAATASSNPVSSGTYGSAAYASAARSIAPRLIPGTATVVQVAALSREDDAEVLASALRERGFAPSIKSDSDDTLYHVQVGPFSREVAFATRQRLLAKGYNAVMK